MEPCQRYCQRLANTIQGFDWSAAEPLYRALVACQQSGNRVFICGNGGSAANAMHIANDLVYGGGKPERGIKAVALTGNSAVITCVANDIDYDDIFAFQLTAHAQEGDLLLALSGSGNSENIVRAIQRANQMQLPSFSILGFAGGRCKTLCDHPLHFPVDDMQIAEDIQLIVGHMMMQRLWPTP